MLERQKGTSTCPNHRAKLPILVVRAFLRAELALVLLSFRAVLLSFREVLLSFRAVSLGDPRVVAGESARLCENFRRFSWLPCVLGVNYRASGNDGGVP